MSFNEDKIADFIYGRLLKFSHLKTERIGNAIVSRVTGSSKLNVILAGHIDTVLPNGNENPVFKAPRLYGIGACDMKGGISVMLKLAEDVISPKHSITYIFYPTEEVGNADNGLLKLHQSNEEIFSAAAAILLEPSSAVIEAGCQGVLRFELRIKGERAHSARPYMGVNAIHRSLSVLEKVVDFGEPKPIVEGLEYYESLQCVFIKGGIQGNVIPDEVILTLSYRFAPNKDSVAAKEFIRCYFEDLLDLSLGDEIQYADVSPSALPSLNNPIIKELKDTVEKVNPKLGWTDVALFQSIGIEACNFGPGDAELAHSSSEYVTKEQLEECYVVLKDLLSDQEES